VSNMTDADLVEPRGERARHLTSQGRAVGDELARVGGFRSAQEIHSALRRRGDRVGLATVYRHLNAMAELGAVDTLQAPSGETLFRRCVARQHHHHLVCRSCGKTIELQGLPHVEAWAARVASSAGFRDVTHTVEVFGTCPDCAAQPLPDSRGLT